MLESDNLLKSLIELVRSTDIFGSLLIQWNSKSNKFELKSQRKRWIYKSRLFTSVLYALFISLQVIWTWKTNDTFINLHSLFMLCGLQLNIYVHSVFYKKAELIVSYLNGMLLFEKERKSPRWKSGGNSKLVKLVMKTMAMSCVSLPLVGHFEVFQHPCLPAYLGGYWFIDTQCGGKTGTDFPATWTTDEILRKILVVLVNYINWSFLMSGDYFHLTLVLLLKSYCLKSYILLAGHKIYESVSGKKKDNWRACLTYREVEVMSTEYRRLYSCYMIADALVSVMFIHIISLYACFSFGFKLPFSLFIMFLMSAVNCGLVLICMYTCLANVYKASMYVLEEQLKTVKCDGMLKPSIWYVKYLKSCKVVKVFIGTTNYVEPLTPLTVEQFNIDQTISLILLDK